MKKVGPTRGLGVRYGSTVRKRYMKVMTELRDPTDAHNAALIALNVKASASGNAKNATTLLQAEHTHQ